MRGALAGILKFSLVLFLASATVFPVAAAAGPLTGATLTFSMGGGDPLAFPADGTLTGSALSAANVTIQQGSAFAGTIVTPLDAPPASALSVTIGSHTAGSWSGDPLTGTSVQINGESVILGFGGVELITVPFAAGAVGTTQIMGTAVDVTVFAQGWTSGTLVIDDGAGGTLATAMGSVVTGTPGSVTLVAGARVASSLTPDDSFNLYTLSMDFERVAPEPAGLLTLSVGGLALAARARRRTV